MTTSVMCTADAVVIHGVGETIPVTFRVEPDGLCFVSSTRLSTRFSLLESSIYLDELVFDSATREITHTIAQDRSFGEECRFWSLRPGSYRVYGVRQSTEGTSTEILGSNASIVSNQ